MICSELQHTAHSQVNKLNVSVSENTHSGLKGLYYKKIF